MALILCYHGAQVSGRAATGAAKSPADAAGVRPLVLMLVAVRTLTWQSAVPHSAIIMPASVRAVRAGRAAGARVLRLRAAVKADGREDASSAGRSMIRGTRSARLRMVTGSA